MKTKSYLTIGLLLLAVGLFTYAQFPLKANGPPRQSAATIIIGFAMSYGRDPDTQHLVAKGLVVDWVTRSSTAPEIPTGSNLADVMAGLQDLGFELLPPTPRTELIFNRRP